MNKKIIGINICMLLICTILPVSENVIADKNYNSKFSGTILYVGGSGPGNYSTIKSAVDDAADGDTIFVYDDSSPYRENITISKSITIQGENKQTTIIDGSNGINHSIHIPITDNVKVTGFTIQNTGTAVYIGGVGGTASHNIITDNIILNSHAGIVIYYGDPYIADFMPYGYNTISNNYIKNTTFYGIVVNEGQYNLITRNTITENHGSAEFGYGWGVRISGAFNNISYNNVFNNDGFGIIISGTYQTVIYRNNIENNGLYGFAIECGSSDMIIQNNFIGNRKLATYDQIIIILLKTFPGHYPILPSTWKENYWGKSRSFPYVIPGFIGYSGFFSVSFFEKFDIIPPNSIRFDWHPAKEPYDI